MANFENTTPLAYQVPAFLKSFGIGRTKLYQLIKTGEIRTVVVGGRRLIPHSEALRLLGDVSKAA